MRIAVDLDGVLADQIRSLTEEVARVTGIQLRGEAIRKYNMLIGEVSIGEIATLALLRPEYTLGMDVMPGAERALGELAYRHHITVATDRLPEADPLSLMWLQGTLLRFHDYVNTHAVGKHTLDADVLIDDYHVNVNMFAATDRPAILFVRPWNALEAVRAGVIRAHNWKEVVHIIEEVL